MPLSTNIPADLAEVVRAAITDALAKRPASQWRGFKGQASRVGLSERYLRALVVRPVNPLPASKVGGRVLLNDSEVDSWLRGQRLGRELDAIANKILSEFED